MQSPLPRLRLLAWALLIVLAYAPAWLRGAWPDPLSTAAWIAAMALAGGALLLLLRTRTLDRLAARLEPAAPWILAGGMALYVIASVAFARARLDAFADYNQLGLFTQSFWTLLHGHPFSNTHETLDGSLGSHFAIHFSPTLLLITPFYALWRDPIVLIAAQALALGLIPLPLYHLLRPRAGAAGALVLSLSVLLLPNVLWAGGRDLRDASFLPALLLGVVWALERRRMVPFLILAIAALGVREEVGPTLVVLGVYALARGHGVKVAFGIAALGAVWFATVVGLVMPRFWSPGLWIDAKRFFASMLGHWGATPAESARAMLTQPGRLIGALTTGDSLHYLYALLRPLLFLPPLGHPLALLAVPGLLLNLLSQLPFMRGAFHAYSLVPLTLLAAATTLVAARLAGAAGEERRRAVALAAGVIVVAGMLPSIPLTRVHAEPPAPPRDAAARAVRAIPPRVPVYAPVTLYPRLAGREDFGCWWSTRERGRAPEFRGRYQWIVLWLDGDPSARDSLGRSADVPLADSLANDPRFVRRTGFDPLIVYERRSRARAE
jgi:uncharacterized membrane protein